MMIAVNPSKPINAQRKPFASSALSSSGKRSLSDLYTPSRGSIIFSFTYVQTITTKTVEAIEKNMLETKSTVYVGFTV